MQITNDPAFDQFLDDEYQSKGYVEARKVVDHLRATVIKTLNDQELEEFRKEFAYAFDMTLK
jgi:hypothetical protein|tara:strand:- start:297 stop:482 length:186 start_codon:yes stop_codon:yes gene_type:complete